MKPSPRINRAVRAGRSNAEPLAPLPQMHLPNRMAQAGRHFNLRAVPGLWIALAIDNCHLMCGIAIALVREGVEHTGLQRLAARPRYGRCGALQRAWPGQGGLADTFARRGLRPSECVEDSG